MPSGEVYEFGPFTLNAPERLLSRHGQLVALAPKSHELLLALVRRAGRLATRRELLDAVWPEAFVEEGILSVHVSTLRKALGDDEPQRRYIETVSRAGYRFVAAARRIADGMKQSVAVLPARLITGEVLSGRDRFTGLAIASGLIDQLGRAPDIVVRPLQQVQAPPNVLFADFIVDTQFTATGDQIRIRVDLIRSRDGAAVWTASFNESATNVVSMASQAAEGIASHLGSTAYRPPARSSPTKPEIHELVGRGRYHLLLASMFEVPKAIDAFQSAVELDPTYAPAHAGLALAHCAQASLRIRPTAESYEAARGAALRALAMDDSSADARVALGAVMLLSEWNWEGAERSLQRALELNPNHSEAYLLYGQLLEAMGRLSDGRAMKMRALERDPFSPLVHLQIAMSCWHQRCYDESIAWANKTLELDPQHPHVREHISAAWLMKGDPDRWLEENVRHAELHKAPSELLRQLKETYAAGGHKAVLAMVLNSLASRPEAAPAMQLAILHGELGKMDLAFEWLDRAIDSRDPCLIHLAVAPQWDSLRSDPRFLRAVTRIGLPEPS